MPVEHLDQLGEVHQHAAAGRSCRPRRSRPGPSRCREQPLQPGPLQRAAGKAAVVVGLADQGPSPRALAGDIGLACLALGVQGVELLLEPLLARLAGVDRAAELADRCLHAALPGASPKNSGPFHRVPVIARAMADSDL